MKRLDFEYEITWSSLCCFIVLLLTPFARSILFQMQHGSGGVVHGSRAHRALSWIRRSRRGVHIRDFDPPNSQTCVDANETIDSLNCGREVPPGALHGNDLGPVDRVGIA